MHFVRLCTNCIRSKSVRQASVSSHRTTTEGRTGAQPLPPPSPPNYTPLNHSTSAAANRYSVDVSRSQRRTSDEYLKLYDYIDTPPADVGTDFKVSYCK